MIPNLERYRKDLEALLERGENLYLSMQRECSPATIEKEIRDLLKDKADGYLKKLPSVSNEYQSWYSEAKALVSQLLPSRLDDFVRHYETPKPRKEITYATYRIEDYLQGLNVTSTRGFEEDDGSGSGRGIAALSATDRNCQIRSDALR